MQEEKQLSGREEWQNNAQTKYPLTFQIVCWVGKILHTSVTLIITMFYVSTPSSVCRKKMQKITSLEDVLCFLFIPSDLFSRAQREWQAGDVSIDGPVFRPLQSQLRGLIVIVWGIRSMRMRPRVVICVASWPQTCKHYVVLFILYTFYSVG